MNIHIEFPSGKKAVFNSGVRVSEILTSPEFRSEEYPVIAASVNNEIVSISYKIEVNSRVEPVLLNSREGVNIYRRSLCYLLTIASKRVFPERRLVIGHSLGKGYYYYYDALDEIPDRDLQKLKEEMKKLVADDLPINHHHMAYCEALEYFLKNNQPDTALLLKNSNYPKVPINSCGDFIDISHGPLAASTGILDIFGIMKYKSGFILRYPSISSPGKLSPFEDSNLLFSIYHEYKEWGKILNISCIGLLNEMVHAGKIRNFIEIAEILHDKKTAYIADNIKRNIDSLKIVLIAGPSSSGKTTFAKKLSLQLKVLGIHPVSLSVDDYFLPREYTPRDSEGNYDFESIRAIDIDKFNDHLQRLEKGEEVETPVYDFVEGLPKKEGKKIRLSDNSILICEGIHGLNNRLTSGIKKEKKFKIYVSALTQLNLDDHNRIPTTDVRLLRRMVRDSQFRGNDAIKTLTMWPSVRRGEDIYIFPFQNSADAAFNSSLDYELSVLKVYVEPLLKTVKPDRKEYNESRRLLAFLNNVAPIPPTWVPSQSILREFIGESGFSY